MKKKRRREREQSCTLLRQVEETEAVTRIQLSNIIIAEDCRRCAVYRASAATCCHGNEGRLDGDRFVNLFPLDGDCTGEGEMVAEEMCDCLVTK